jgi:hypothetical protein
VSLTLDEALIRLEDLQSVARERDAQWRELLAIPADVDAPADDPEAYPIRARIKALDARANVIAAEIEEGWHQCPSVPL